MKLSKNFNLSEFAVSAAASAKGIVIVIPDEYIPNIQAFVENVLQPICDATGWHDQVNSGYRPPEVNKLVGGVANSMHLEAKAADNMFYKMVEGKKVYIKPIDVLKKAVELNLDFDQMIAYNGFVHLSYTTSKKNRKQILYNSSYTGERL